MVQSLRPRRLSRDNPSRSACRFDREIGFVSFYVTSVVQPCSVTPSMSQTSEGKLLTLYSSRLVILHASFRFICLGRGLALLFVPETNLRQGKPHGNPAHENI